VTPPQTNARVRLACCRRFALSRNAWCERVAPALEIGAPCSRSPIPRSPRFAICATAPGPTAWRALELLAASPEGCIEALMLANGFPVEMLVELIRTGLASAQFTEYTLKCRPAQRMS
jgi:hypothetical protein